MGNVWDDVLPEEDRLVFEAAGWGKEVGFGDKPVLLVVDERVVRLGGTERVAPDLVRAPGLVDGRVVEVLARGVPRGATDGA